MQCGARVGLDEFDAIPEREILGRYRTPSPRSQTCKRHSATWRKRGDISIAHSKISRRPRSKHYSDESVPRSLTALKCIKTDPIENYVIT